MKSNFGLHTLTQRLSFRPQKKKKIRLSAAREFPPIYTAAQCELFVKLMLMLMHTGGGDSSLVSSLRFVLYAINIHELHLLSSRHLSPGILSTY